MGLGQGLGAAAAGPAAGRVGRYQVDRQGRVVVVAVEVDGAVVAAVSAAGNVLVQVALVDDVERDGRGAARRWNARRGRQRHLNGWRLYADDRRWIAIHRVNVAAAVDQNISSSLRTWWYER